MAGSWALEDLLLFEPQVYWRLFALENESVWPVQPVVLAAVALLALCFVWGRRPAGRWLGPVFGAAWLWTGWQFVALRYGTVNWVAPTLAWGFYAEAALLAALGLSGRLVFLQRGRRAWSGSGLLAAAVLAWPALAPLDGRSWREAEVFAIAPDPTAIATLGLLALAGAQPVDGSPVRRAGAVACGLRAHALHHGCLAGLGGACSPARRPRRLGRARAKSCRRRPVNALLRPSSCRDRAFG